jgi:hypothetical protein
MVTERASSPAKATGTAQGSLPANHIRMERAEKAFKLACDALFAMAIVVQRAYPRRADPTERVATASSHAVMLWASAQMMMVSRDIMDRTVTPATLRRLSDIISRVENGSIGFMSLWDDADFERYPDLQGDVPLNAWLHAAYLAIDKFDNYLRGRVV